MSVHAARPMRAEEIVKAIDLRISAVRHGPLGAVRYNCRELADTLATADTALAAAWDYLNRTDTDEQFGRFLELLHAYERGHDALRQQGC